MRKMINIILILGLLVLIYQFFINIFINKHDIKYSLVTDNNNFLINEKYEKNSGVSTYSFSITDKNKKKFIYSYLGDFNKQRRIIKDIISYKTKDLYCVAPVFKNDKVQNMICLYKNNLVTYSYLKQIENKDIDKFIKKISNTKYEVNLEYKDINNAKKDYNNISVYNEFDSNLYFTIWNYNGVYTINNDKTKLISLLNNDSYENEYSILANKYYIVVNTDEGFNSFYIVNIMNGKKTKISIKDEISGNMYFNGIYKNKVYLTDITNKKQYVIDPKKKSISLLDEPKYYDGDKLSDIDILLLTKEKRYFINNSIPKKLLKKYGNNIKYSLGNYYYEDQGNVYQIIGDNYNNKVLLFHFNDFKELKVLNGNVYGISKDTVYMYNNDVGLKKIIKDRELIYNYKNIFDVYGK